MVRVAPGISVGLSLQVQNHSVVDGARKSILKSSRTLHILEYLSKDIWVELSYKEFRKNIFLSSQVLVFGYNPPVELPVVIPTLQP